MFEQPSEGSCHSVNFGQEVLCDQLWFFFYRNADIDEVGYEHSVIDVEWRMNDSPVTITILNPFLPRP